MLLKKTIVYVGLVIVLVLTVMSYWGENTPAGGTIYSFFGGGWLAIAVIALLLLVLVAAYWILFGF